MALTEQEVIEAESYWCECCCNFDKEHIGMDGMALCKITNTLAYSEECGKDCPFFNKPKSRFIELPCAVGDTVYMPWEFDGNKGVAILTVTHIIFDSLHAYIRTDLTSDCDEYLAAYNYGRFSFKEFGKTVFLTKEEAEKALEERK